jgi:hypothetical protein
MLPGEGCALLDVPVGSIAPSDIYRGDTGNNSRKPQGVLLQIALGWLTLVGIGDKSESTRNT